MHLSELLDIEELERAVADGLVSARFSGTGLTIYNYTPKAAHTPGTWDNEAIRHCRGLIVDSTGRIIARPWAKFFNYGQPDADHIDLDEVVTVTDKMDGSLGIVYWDESLGAYAVSTRGSFESDQAKHASENIHKYIVGYDDNTYTLLVEIVYPKNKIVLDYGDLDELVLLGAVNKVTGEYLGTKEARKVSGWNGDEAECFGECTLREALAIEPRPNAEGLVVRVLGTQRMVKIKQEDYIALHHAIFGLTPLRIWEWLMGTKPISELIDSLPKEVREWIEDEYAKIVETQSDLVLGVYDRFDEIYDYSDVKMHRAEFAAKALGQKYTMIDGTVIDIAGLLFMAYDEKSIYMAALKLSRPKA